MSKNKKKCCCVPKPPVNDPTAIYSVYGNCSSSYFTTTGLTLEVINITMTNQSSSDVIVINTQNGISYFKANNDCLIQIAPNAASCTMLARAGGEEITVSALFYCSVGPNILGQNILNNHPFNDFIGKNVTNNVERPVLINNSTIIKLKKDEIFKFWADANNTIGGPPNPSYKLYIKLHFDIIVLSVS